MGGMMYKFRSQNDTTVAENTELAAGMLSARIAG